LSRRAGGLAALAVPLAAYYALDDHLWEARLWWDIAWLTLVLVPAVFALIYLALPLWRERRLIVLAAAFALLAVVAQLASAEIVANFAKLAAMTFVAWWFLTFFEALGWVVIVACIIPFVDAYSVWRGPTRQLVDKQEHVFTTLSIAFPEPGGGDSANLGLPDVLFFALFLGTAMRFRLRPFWTWLGMVLSIGATMTLAVAFKVRGLPALPLLSLGFLLPNIDLIWRRLRPARTA
jgi:hypothetical protein